MLGVVFLFNQFSTIKNFLFTIKDIDFLSSNSEKKNFCLEIFLLSSGGLQFVKMSMFGPNYARFEDCIHNAESTTRIFTAWLIIPLNKIIPNWIKAS